mmetsp:Transcript_9518/g.35611  ORF Transcript_9518/g.35611 Transcript_9518/m.35611 type:complete len:215 (+) Transcript_9518:2240-2884(+)
MPILRIGYHAREMLRADRDRALEQRPRPYPRMAESAFGKPCAVPRRRNHRSHPLASCVQFQMVLKSAHDEAGKLELIGPELLRELLDDRTLPCQDESNLHRLAQLLKANAGHQGRNQCLQIEVVRLLVPGFLKVLVTQHADALLHRLVSFFRGMACREMRRRVSAAIRLSVVYLPADGSLHSDLRRVAEDPAGNALVGPINVVANRAGQETGEL